jgi:hypothetical protein
VLQQSENLEATVTDAPMLSYGAKKDFALKGAVELTFVNNGNRPIAVVDATMLLNQDVSADDPECFGRYVAEVPLKLAAFVIKPSEVLIRRLEAPQGDINGFTELGSNKAKDAFNVAGCVQMRIVTSRGGEIVTEYFGSWGLEARKAQTTTGATIPNYPSPVRRTPMAFLNRSGIRFWSDMYENATYRIWLLFNKQ